MYYVEWFSHNNVFETIKHGMFETPVFMEDGPFKDMDTVEDYIISLGKEVKQVRIIER